MTLASTISPSTWALFNVHEISGTAWLKTPSSTWGGNESYEKLNPFVTKLLITRLFLTTVYIKIVTRMRIKGSTSCRKRFPNAKKSTLMQ
jgi:hypothetical protein